MPRRLRHIPAPGTLVEVTCRTIHGRMLLKPSRPLNEMIIGTLARAKRLYGVRICAVVFLSNHGHLLLEVDDAEQMAAFMGYVKSNIAREVGRHVRWHETIWGQRYAGIIVSNEPAAQIARLRYLLAHGVKEHLVARCAEWPGVHAAEALITGRSMVGYWFDRTAESSARARGRRFGTYTHATLEPLVFDPLPCWRHLDAADYQQRVADMVARIEAEAASERRVRNMAPLGVKAIQRQNARRRPRVVKRSPAPAFHAATKRVRQELRDAYRWFEAAYRDAAERLRTGKRNVTFPEGCFPPPLPFVPLMS